MKKKIIIKFKDGYEVPIICDEFTVGKTSISGELAKVSWKGVTNIQLLHFDLAEVRMIYQDLTYTDQEDMKQEPDQDQQAEYKKILIKQLEKLKKVGIDESGKVKIWNGMPKLIPYVSYLNVLDIIDKMQELIGDDAG